MGKDSDSWLQRFRQLTKALGGAAPRLFRPMYAQANMGHPSREEGFVLCSQLCNADELHQSSYPTWFRNAFPPQKSSLWSETGLAPPPAQANFRRKTSAPNVTCNVWGVGLASKVCHFKKILQFSMNRAAQPRKASKTHLEPRSWVAYGLSTTCWGRHVASGERDR
jgi:hypothetical protein